MRCERPCDQTNNTATPKLKFSLCLFQKAAAFSGALGQARVSREYLDLIRLHSSDETSLVGDLHFLPVE